MTKPEEAEEYLLSPTNEAEAVDREVERLKKHAAWRMAQKGLSSMEILSRIAQVPEEDWVREIDRHDLFRRLNSNRLYERWQKEQRKKELQEAEQKQKELKEFWTAKQMYRLMQWTSENTYGKRLIVNDNTLPLMKALAYLLSGDERFETELGYSLKKGLIIRGVSGLGKTHLVKCIAENEQNPVKVFSMLEIAAAVKLEGEFAIGTTRAIYLDDVGTETVPVKYYGTDINWFKDFIESYYTSGQPFSKVILSTNLSFALMEEKYGYRVRSRMKEMFNVIDIEGEDLRGV